jgi:hypothetical protein
MIVADDNDCKSQICDDICAYISIYCGVQTLPQCVSGSDRRRTPCLHLNRQLAKNDRGRYPSRRTDCRYSDTRIKVLDEMASASRAGGALLASERTPGGNSGKNGKLEACCGSRLPPLIDLWRAVAEPQPCASTVLKAHSGLDRFVGLRLFASPTCWAQPHVPRHPCPDDPERALLTGGGYGFGV